MACWFQKNYVVGHSAGPFFFPSLTRCPICWDFLLDARYKLIFIYVRIQWRIAPDAKRVHPHPTGWPFGRRGLPPNRADLRPPSPFPCIASFLNERIFPSQSSINEPLPMGGGCMCMQPQGIVWAVCASMYRCVPVCNSVCVCVCVWKCVFLFCFSSSV